MTHRALVELLIGVYADKAALRRRHELGARVVRQFDRNNTYQYVLAREDVHLAWLRDAVAAEGAEPPPAPPDPVLDADETDVAKADVAAQEAFIDKWAGRLPGVTHARHRLMLDLLMGESREQLRFLQQAAAGRTDLLGRRTTASPAAGDVLSRRWVG